MTAPAAILKALTAQLPLTIQFLECNDPSLVLVGEDWSIALLCPWRIVLDGKMIAGADEYLDHSKLAPILIGNMIVSCTFQGRLSQLDPVLVLASGHVFETFSSFAVEPWIVRLEGNKLYVANPSA